MRSIIIMGFISGFLMACNGGGGGGGGGSSETAQTHYGIWEHCENYDANSDSTNDSSLKRILIVGDSGISLIRTNHDSINCSLGSEAYRFVNHYDYTRSINQYTFVLKSEKYVSLSDADVSYNNTTSWCGINNWVKNQVRNIIGRTCEGEVSYVGDTSSLALSRSGNGLSIGVINYSLTADVDLEPANQTFPNGNYIYSDGISFATYATFTNGAYSFYRYNLLTMTSSRENGTYTSSNNVVTFTVTSSLPVGCYTGSESRRFNYGTGGVVVEFEAENLVLISPKVSDSESLFRSAYLGGTFSTGCI